MHDKMRIVFGSCFSVFHLISRALVLRSSTSNGAVEAAFRASEYPMMYRKSIAVHILFIVSSLVLGLSEAGRQLGGSHTYVVGWIRALSCVATVLVPLLLLRVLRRKLSSHTVEIIMIVAFALQTVSILSTSIAAMALEEWRRSAVSEYGPFRNWLTAWNIVHGVLVQLSGLRFKALVLLATVKFAGLLLLLALVSAKSAAFFEDVVTAPDPRMAMVLIAVQSLALVTSFVRERASRSEFISLQESNDAAAMQERLLGRIVPPHVMAALMVPSNGIKGPRASVGNVLPREPEPVSHNVVDCCPPRSVIRSKRLFDIDDVRHARRVSFKGVRTARPQVGALCADPRISTLLPAVDVLCPRSSASSSATSSMRARSSLCTDDAPALSHSSSIIDISGLVSESISAHGLQIDQPASIHCPRSASDHSMCMDVHNLGDTISSLPRTSRVSVYVSHSCASENSSLGNSRSSVVAVCGNGARGVPQGSETMGPWEAATLSSSTENHDQSSVVQYIPEATVMFIGVNNFDYLASRVPPLSMLTSMNALFSLFDHFVEAHKVYKVLAINGMYLCIAAARGLGEDNPFHARACVDAAIDICISVLQADSSFFIAGESPALKIGICTGAVAAGVIGTKTLNWHIFVSLNLGIFKPYCMVHLYGHLPGPVAPLLTSYVYIIVVFPCLALVN